MTTQAYAVTKAPSKGSLWTSRVISALVILFLLFDAIMKIIKESHSIQGSAALGWPVEKVQLLGFILLVFTILYAIPRTAIFGAILVTSYLGGAVAIGMRAGISPWFAIIFIILTWAAIYLRNEKLRELVPFVKAD